MLRGDKRKVVISGMLGNGLEWYDYALYGHMSFVISKLFFPSADASTSLILTFLTFAVGFLSRPFGAVLFGRLGDRYGRKKALTTSMILMGVATCTIGLLPTYAMIGVAAPVLLLVIRILQGISLGGAFSGSMSYVVEHAPASHRARAGSYIIMSLVVGFLSGSLVSMLVSSLMGEAQFYGWGWRLPFLFGVGIGLVGFYIRSHAEESPVYEQAKREGTLSPSPVRDAFMVHGAATLKAFLLYLFVAVPFYTVSIYLIAYSKTHLGLTAREALLANSVALGAMFLALYPGAWLADRIGRKPVMLSGILLTLALAYPAFAAMQGASLVVVVLVQALLGFLLGWYQSPLPAILVELFPTSIRYTGMSLVSNFCAIIGGFSPALAEWMIKTSGDTNAVVALFFASGVPAFIGISCYRDRWREQVLA